MVIFQNEPVELGQLPQVADVPLIPIEKDYLKVMRLEWLVVSAILVTATTILAMVLPVFATTNALLLLSAGCLLIIIGYFVFQTMVFRHRAYALREKDIIYQSGFFIKDLTVCPFNRVQNSSVSNGPFERKFNLSTLHLYTAGTSGAEIHLRGLKTEDALRIKDWIAKKISDEVAAGA